MRAKVDGTAVSVMTGTFHIATTSRAKRTASMDSRDSASRLKLSPPHSPAGGEAAPVALRRGPAAQLRVRVTLANRQDAVATDRGCQCQCQSPERTSGELRIACQLVNLRRLAHLLDRERSPCNQD